MKRLTLIAFALGLLGASSALQAKEYPEPAGGCPKGHQLTLKAETGAPRSRWCRPPKERSSTSDSGGSGGAVYMDPTAKRVAKASPLGWCPTGYYTNGDNCTTPWEGAPASTRKSGSCPSGTVEEHGAYCTAAITDTSNDTLDRLDAAATRDFNVVYTHSLAAGKAAPKQVLGEALAAALAKRNAAGNPWMDKPSRGRAAAAPAEAERQRKAQAEATALDNHRNDQLRIGCEAARPNFPNGFPPGTPCAELMKAGGSSAGAIGQQAAAIAQNPQDAVKEAAKQEVGKALRGLFGK